MDNFPVETISHATVIKLPLRVDVSNTQGMVAAIRDQIARDRRYIVLDLSQTDAIDSTALGAIVQLFKALRVGEGDLVFANVGEGVKRILMITRLDRVFTILPSVDDAVTSVAA